MKPRQPKSLTEWLAEIIAEAQVDWKRGWERGKAKGDAKTLDEGRNDKSRVES